MSDDTLQLALEALEASIDDVRECLDDLRPHSGWARYDQRIAACQTQIERHELAIEGVKAMIAERALQAMKDNARELGLTYDASVVRIDTSTQRVEKEAGNKDVPTPPECKTEAEKTAFAFGWFKALESVREQPAPAQPLTDEQERQAFEAYALHTPLGSYSTDRRGDGEYWSSHTQLMWETWQARAAHGITKGGV
jgi:hypothetical protein